MLIALDSETAPQSGGPITGERSLVLHERGRSHFWEGRGSLSIKSFCSGEAFYDVGHGRFRVDQHTWLLLNHDQHYAISVEADHPVESFCLFFARGFAEEVQRSLSADSGRLLDDPEETGDDAVSFPERTFPHDEILMPLLRRFRTQFPLSGHDRVWLGERMHEAMQRLLLVHRLVRAEVESLPAVRAATRAEIYRRVHRAADFIAASFEQSLTLSEMARVACLSPNHFLRTFRQVLRRTPHQYLTECRLERAQALLIESDLPVIDICLSVGFSSPGSFSSLFRRHVGLSPDGFRRRKR